MSFLHIVVLALVQGITEFLPISSQGHLVLADKGLVAAGLAPGLVSVDQQLSLNVAVHVGTLGAVVIYFRRDVGAMFAGVGHLLAGRWTASARLVAYVFVGTLPLLPAGYLLSRAYPEALNSLEVIGWATLGFGIVLYAADRAGMTVRRLEHMRFLDPLVIGVAQVLALIPGTSRSGITMTAARMLGFERPDAARFSLLLSMPAILGAGLVKGKDLAESGDAALTAAAILAALFALVAALVAIWAMMAWLRRASFTPFVVYRVILGAVLLTIAYG